MEKRPYNSTDKPKSYGSKCDFEISVLIPVFKPENYIYKLIKKLHTFSLYPQTTASGNTFIINEIILICDGAIDNSIIILESLSKQFDCVKVLWLSRNYGQHAALFAGIDSSISEWIVTMDGDGEHSPDDISLLVDTAMKDRSFLVYADLPPSNNHGYIRNLCSKITKKVFYRLLDQPMFPRFSSYRLILGKMARALSSRVGVNTYLDVALTWVVTKPSYCKVSYTYDTRRPSSYNFPKLIEHFIRLILTSGNRPLRIITFLGIFCFGISMILTGYVLISKLLGLIPAIGTGWTSLVIIISFFSSTILISLGLLAEYIALTLMNILGKPHYLKLPESPSRVFSNNRKNESVNPHNYMLADNPTGCFN